MAKPVYISILFFLLVCLSACPKSAVAQTVPDVTDVAAESSAAGASAGQSTQSKSAVDYAAIERTARRAAGEDFDVCLGSSTMVRLDSGMIPWDVGYADEMRVEGLIFCNEARPEQWRIVYINAYGKVILNTDVTVISLDAAKEIALKLALTVSEAYHGWHGLQPEYFNAHACLCTGNFTCPADDLLNSEKSYIEPVEAPIYEIWYLPPETICDFLVVYVNALNGDILGAEQVSD